MILFWPEVDTILPSSFCSIFALSLNLNISTIIRFFFFHSHSPVCIRMCLMSWLGFLKAFPQ